MGKCQILECIHSLFVLLVSNSVIKRRINSAPYSALPRLQDPGLGRRKLNWSLLNLAEPNSSHYNQLATLFDINLLLCPMSSLWTRIRQKFLLHPTDSRHNWLGCKYVNMNRIKRFGRMIRFGLFFSPPTFFTTSMILYMDTSDAWLGW